MGTHSLTSEQKEQYKSLYEENCKKAAEVISQADIMLFAHGAGMSADSNLPVFADIAKFEAYAQMKLTYTRICNPGWLRTDPDIFYGFWGKCYNEYKRTTPHNGYTIVKKWRDKFFSEKPENKEMIEAHRDKFLLQNALYFYMRKDDEPVDIGPFYVYTSNIDSHSLKSGLFKQNEVFEIHGTTEKWQCGYKCTDKVWDLPEDYGFEVDFDTMRCSQDPPKCPECGRPARPWVLMFGDGYWADIPEFSRRYAAWQRSMITVAKERNLKVVVLEVGAGTNVPSVRANSEEVCTKLPENCTIIRINLDFPHTGKAHLQSRIISIMERGLPALTKIDEFLNNM